MKVMVKEKEEAKPKTGAKPVIDKHMAKTMKRLARDRFMQRQTDVPDNNM